MDEKESSNMATTTKTVTKTVKRPGKTVKTTKTTDSGKQTGRQQYKTRRAEIKGKMSTQGAALAAGGEIAGTVATTVTSKHNAEVQKERARQQTYQAAINKWNGILKSTPVEAEGTNPPEEGTSNKTSGATSTGTNPNDIIGW